MKTWKIGLIIVLSFFVCILTFFVYTRFGLDKYEIKENTLIFKNNIYVRVDTLSASDQENLGETIGIAIDGKRKLTDFIWPFWVIEYNNDKKHNHIFVRGLMDLGSVFKKES